MFNALHHVKAQPSSPELDSYLRDLYEWLHTMLGQCECEPTKYFLHCRGKSSLGGSDFKYCPKPKSLQKIIQVNFTLKVEPSIRQHTTHLSSRHFSALLDTHTCTGKVLNCKRKHNCRIKVTSENRSWRFGPLWEIWNLELHWGPSGSGFDFIYIYLYIYIFFLCLSKIVSWSSESFISLCAWWATASLPCSEGN